MDLDRIRAYLTLNSIEHHANVVCAPLINDGIDIEDIVSFTALQWEEFFSKSKVNRIMQTVHQIDSQEMLDRVLEKKIGLLPIEDEDYPELLKEIYNPPQLLFYLGKLPPKDSIHIAVVGSRDSSLQGRCVAEDFGQFLARNGVSVVSGFARGIDRAAHKGAVQCKPPGYAVGVVGVGIQDFLKPKLFDLYEKVLQNGMIVSEFPLGFPARKQNFPLRNRIITGMSLATVIVEASIRSGSMISAKLALEQGREVFAIPGPIHSQTSEGTNFLIREGATLLSKFEDLFEDLNLELEEGDLEGLSEQELHVLEALSRTPMPVEELVYSLVQPLGKVAKTLLELEERGLVKRHPGDLVSKIH